MLNATLFLLLAPMADPVPIVPAKLDRKTPIDFVKDIKPIMTAKCSGCHTGWKAEGGYYMVSAAGIIKGGKRGPAVIPGKPDESLMYQLASHAKKPIMPPKTDDNPLTPVELAMIRRWIEEGAKAPAVEPKPTRPAVALSFPAATVRPVRALAVTPDGGTVIIGRANRLEVYDAKAGTLKKSLIDPALKTPQGGAAIVAHVSLIESMALSPDGEWLATGSFREVVLWDLKEGTIKHRWTGFAHNVVALAFDAKGERLATGGGVPTEEGEVRILDVASAAVITELTQPHTDTVFGVAFSPDGTLLATASADKFVKVFDVETKTVRKKFEGHTNHVLDVAWMADGKRLLSAGADGVIKVWDLEKGEKVRDITGFTKQINRMARIGATPTFLTAAGDGQVKIINGESGASNRTLQAGNDFVYAVVANGDSSVVAAGGEDGVVRLFDGKTGRALRELAPPKAP